MRRLAACPWVLVVLAIACDAPTTETKSTPAASASTPEIDSKAHAGSKPESKADSKPESKTDSKPQAKVDAKPDAKPEPPTLSPEARAEYRKRLEAGRKLAKAKQWADAIVELDAALVAIPGDDRALGELSWATFSAGDFKRAREAANASVRAATAPKVRGAALYNLGRAEEASGDPAAAIAAYEASIAARPNKTVADRLAALRVAAPEIDDALPCSTPVPHDDVCTCLLASLDPENRPEPDCTMQPTGAHDLEIARYTISDVGEESRVIVAKNGSGWGVVGRLVDVYNPGMMGISEEWTDAPAVERTVGGRVIVELGGSKARSDSDMGIDEIESEDTDVLVICVRGQAGAPTTCPLRRITSYVYLRERFGMDETDDPEVAALRTPGLPIRDEGTLVVEVGDDGVARVRATKGDAPDTVGDVRLW